MKRTSKPLARQAAFTLIELVLVILVIAVLASFAFSRFSDSDAFLADSTAEQVIAVAQLAQQLSMNDSARTFSLVVSSNTLDIRADGASISVGGYNFPLAMPGGVTLSPAPTTITFDSLGATSALTINVNAGVTRSVCLESSGYIHPC